MKFLVMPVILFFCSCKVSDKNLLGQYEAKSYHRSVIILDSNNKFNFWNDGYEFLLSNDNFLCTQGSWTMAQKNRLLLNSISDSIAIPRFSITKEKLNSKSRSKFTFLNLNKDTVLIYTVYKNNSLIFYRSHGSFLTSFEDSLTNSDTLTFTFTWGFKPVQILIADNEPAEYVVTLNREFRPNYFQNVEFIIRRNKLIRVTEKSKFRKMKKKGI